MSEPLALADVEARIMDLDRLLEAATHAQRQRFCEAADADTAYDVAYSQAFLLAKEGKLAGQESRASDLAAKAHAIVVCADKLTQRNITAALLESAREAARNARAQLEAMRTLAATARALTIGG